MNRPESFRVGVSDRIGHNADAIRVPSQAVQVMTSGTPGLTPTGAIPDTFEAEARQAWRNVRKILTAAGAGLGDIVSVRTWLTNAADIPTYSEVHSQLIHHEPVFFLGVVQQLIWPRMRVQVEVIASVRPGQE